jgi:hypothetical protein
MWGDDPMPKLAGNGIKTQELLDAGVDVVIAKVIFPGYASPESSGVAGYDRAEIEIAKTIRGSLSGRKKVYYSVFDMPPNPEVPTIRGEKYIFFVGPEEAPQVYEVRKILLASQKNIDDIEALIASRGLRTQPSAH